MEIGVLVVSDRVSAGEAQDRSGVAAVDYLKRNIKNHTNIHVEVVPDEIEKIQEVVLNWVGKKVSLIITSGTILNPFIILLIFNFSFGLYVN